MRICYVIPTLGVGGTELQLTRLVRGLVREHEVMVLCTRRDGALAGDMRRLGASVRVLHCRGGWDFRTRGRALKLFSRRAPDIVHSFLFGFDLPINRAAREAGVPVVISSRRQLAL